MTARRHEGRWSALTTAVQVAVGLLVAGEYDALAATTYGRRLSAKQLRDAVSEYGRTLRSLPDDEWTTLDVVEVPDAEVPTFHVVVDLWTEEEGRSDLSLELLMKDTDGGAFETEILDLHVL